MVNLGDNGINSNISRVVFKLKLYRELANYSQVQFAQILSMSLRTYQRLESGNASLDLGMIFKISHYLKIDLNEWLAKTDPKLDSNVKIIDDCEGYGLNPNHLNLISDFDKIKTVEEAQEFSNGDYFKKLSDPSFVCINTKKIANDKVLQISNLEKITKVTAGHPDPFKVIKFMDQIYFLKPKYTFVDPIALPINSATPFCSINIHRYLDSNILILSLLLPKTNNQFK